MANPLCGGCGNYICSCPVFTPGWPYVPPRPAINKIPTPTMDEINDILKLKPKDNVNSPAHYNHNWREIECIDAIEASMTPVEFLGYLKGNIMKYTWRYPYKNTAEDIEKGKWYYAKLAEKFKEYTDKKLITTSKKGLQNA